MRFTLWLQLPRFRQEVEYQIFDPYYLYLKTISWRRDEMVPYFRHIKIWEQLDL
jgi:hypothetical protein